MQPLTVPSDITVTPYNPEHAPREHVHWMYNQGQYRNYLVSLDLRDGEVSITVNSSTTPHDVETGLRQVWTVPGFPTANAVAGLLNSKKLRAALTDTLRAASLHRDGSMTVGTVGPDEHQHVADVVAELADGLSQVEIVDAADLDDEQITAAVEAARANTDLNEPADLDAAVEQHLATTTDPAGGSTIITGVDAVLRKREWNEREQHHRQLATIAKKIARKQHAINQAKGREAELRNRVAELKNQVDEVDEELTPLRRRERELLQQLAEVREEMQPYRDQQNELREQVRQTRDQAREMKQKARRERDAMNALIPQRDALVVEESEWPPVKDHRGRLRDTQADIADRAGVGLGKLKRIMREQRDEAAPDEE